jgi:hypothetical protein
MAPVVPCVNDPAYEFVLNHDGTTLKKCEYISANDNKLTIRQGKYCVGTTPKNLEISEACYDACNKTL